MSRGKAHAQSGHAYLESFLQATRTHPDIAARYARLAPGTKICLAADGAEILRLHEALGDAGIPSALVIDRDHVEPPDFDGSPILTALGVGPLRSCAAAGLLDHLPLWPGRGRRKGGAMT